MITAITAGMGITCPFALTISARVAAPASLKGENCC